MVVDTEGGYGLNITGLMETLENKLTTFTGEPWRVRFLEAFSHDGYVNVAVGEEHGPVIDTIDIETGLLTGDWTQSAQGLVRKGPSLGYGIVVMAPLASLQTSINSNNSLDNLLSTAGVDGGSNWGSAQGSVYFNIIDGWMTPGPMVDPSDMWDPAWNTGTATAAELLANYGNTRLKRFKALFDIPAGDAWETFIIGAPTGTDWGFLFRNGKYGFFPTLTTTGFESGLEASATVDINNFQSLKIIEVPYAQTAPVAVMDLPPIFPQVDIFPIWKNPNKIKINLTQNTYKKRFFPVIIEESDIDVFNFIEGIQGGDVSKGLLFAGDDTDKTYEVFRTEEMPYNYSDFRGKKIKTLSTQVAGGLQTTAAAMVDNIKPNITYYYCFRTIDKNGFLSIPSPVLSVQLVDESGMVYPIIEPFTFPDENPRSTTKGFRRYLEIGASVEQAAFRTLHPLAEAALAPHLRPTEPPWGLTSRYPGEVWSPNTTFKVRVISKDTGKKIDINVNLSMSAVANPDLTVLDPEDPNAGVAEIFATYGHTYPGS